MAYRAIPPARPRTPRDYSAPAESAVVFDNVAFQSNWQGVGFNFALLNAIPGYGLTAQQIATDWDRVAASGAKIVSTWCDQSWSMPSYSAGSADWTSADMTGFWAGVQAMKDRGINVAIRAGWHFPQNVGALSGAAPITPTVPQEVIYAAWVSELLNQAINARGLTNVTVCQFFTEPTSSKGTIPGGYAQPWDYYAHMAAVTATKIVTDDGGRTPIRPRITLIGPGEFSQSADPWLEGVKAAAPTALDAYAAHSYYSTPGFAPFGMAPVNAADYQAWVDLFVDWVGDASTKALYADEGGFLTGDTDPNGYTGTADCGWQWSRQVIGHMNAGCASSWPWLLEDQPILGAVLQYGSLKYIGTSADAKPAFKAMSMVANLTGGSGTSLYRILGLPNSTLHGVGCVLPSGDITVVLINDSALPIRTGVTFKAPLSTARTFYRYTYSGEIPTDTVATPLAWDMTVGGQAGLASTVIPGRSVVAFSTKLMTAGTTNLALSAVASTDSVGIGDVRSVIDGNFSNVQGAYNGWRKVDDASHYAQLTWNSPQTIGRASLAFVGTTIGQVYATYTDTSTPAPVADYTLQYLSASGSWTTLAAVTGNTSPNRSHAFTAVSTTALRLNVTSAAATAQVNQIGAYAP